jgi:two-component system phosphate regulon sensor histidine kinase PhoR
MLNNPLKKRGIFRRMFILYTVIILAAVLFIELFISEAVRDNYVNTVKDHLAVQAALISDEVSFRTSVPLDALCKRFKEKTGSRVTIIALDGKVLGDSDSLSSAMDNHSHRQEIQQAGLNGTGMAIRLSDTLQYDFLYFASKIMKGAQPEGFVRLSVPLREIDGAVNALRIKILSIIIIILLATGILSLWQIERIRRLTEQIRDFSRSIANGDLGKKLFLDRTGEFYEIAGSLNTMALELKNGLAAQEEERHRLNVILRNIPDALFIMDAQGTIVLSSSAARNIFGDIQFQGRPFIEVIRNSEFASLMEEAKRRRSSGVKEVRFDSPFERHCVVQVNPLFYRESELSGFAVVFHDITQLQKLEQTRKDFIANISHEIKTPITTITGFAETLLDGAIDDRSHAVKFLETIKTNGERINSLVDDLMMISKIEVGVIKVEKSPQDIQQVMEQTIEALEEKASDKGLSLTVSIHADLKEVNADRGRLLQILTNLVDNAIKFTEKGGVMLGTATEDNKACLFVEDTGIGIPQKYLPRIGERFFRVDPGRSRNMGGTGLGLAIVKHLVKAHGWDMQIESTPGKGTKVKIFVL